MNTTTNSGDIEASSDAVRLQAATSETIVLIDGNRFVLHVEFGHATDEGFSLVNEFNVFENRTASAELRGYFTRLDAVSGASVAWFDNARGPDDMTVSGIGTDTFQWGVPSNAGAEFNRFHFAGTESDDFEVASGAAILTSQRERRRLAHSISRPGLR